MKQVHGDPLNVTVGGEVLNAELNKLGRPTVEAIYGKPLSDELHRFAKLTQFVTNQKDKPTSGIVAASVALHPLKHLGKIGEMLTMKHLMVTPGFIHWINEGLAETNVSKAMAAFTRASSYAAAEVRQQTGAPPPGLPVIAPEKPQRSTQ
jgi:hypothetical protein